MPPYFFQKPAFICQVPRYFPFPPVALQLLFDSFFFKNLAVGDLTQTLNEIFLRSLLLRFLVGSFAVAIETEPTTDFACAGPIVGSAENKTPAVTAADTHICCFITIKMLTNDFLNQAGRSSNISVTNAAIGDRSDLVNVTCANNGCPLSFSTTATTPSCLPTRKLSRWATS